MVEKARELAEKNGWFLCRQFETDANWRFHYDSTGPEIVNDLGGTALDYWVTGYGAFDRWLGSAPPPLLASTNLMYSFLVAGLPEKGPGARSTGR